MRDYYKRLRFCTRITMFTPPSDMISEKAGMRILTKIDVANIGGGLNTSTAAVQKNRAQLLRFLRGYMEEFYRIRRLPPYVFEQVNRAKAAARNAGADIIDLGMMPKMRGVELVQRLREIDNGALVLLITAFGTIESAVEAMRAGAFHYVTKPFHNEEILIQVKRALEQKRLEQELQRLRTEVRAHNRFQNIIGQSAAMQKILETVAQVSDLPANILIEGESGTGKELIARAIHV